MPTYAITGARGGIGLEYVRQLSQDSSNTIIALIRDLNADLTNLKAVQSGAKASVHILEVDISSPTSIAQLSSHLTSALGSDVQINTLINNAAVLQSKDQNSLTVTPDALQSHFNSNVIGPALVLQTLLPNLAPNALIANITSGMGSLSLLSEGKIGANITPYSISKAALNMLTVHQAKHLEGKAIVVCVDPGHVKTEMGGPNAVVEIKDSAGSILKVLAGLGEKDSGKFFLYTGEELPW